MYQQNGKQRNKANVFLVSFFLSRSSSKPRPKSSQSVHPENLKCAICGQYEKVGNGKNSELAGSHEQKIYRKPLVTLRMKYTAKSVFLIKQIFSNALLVLSNFFLEIRMQVKKMLSKISRLLVLRNRC